MNDFSSELRNLDFKTLHHFLTLLKSFRKFILLIWVS